MSEQRLPPLADLPHRLREGLAHWPENFRQWRQDLRKDPGLVWRTPGARVVVWLVLGAVLVLGLRWGVGMLTPSGGGTLFVEATPEATLYVACTNPSCRAHYTTRQPMDFNDWPLKCEKCGSESVYRAKLCPVCRSWFAIAPGQPAECPFCAARRKAEQPAEPVGPKVPEKIDDAEDPWD